MPHAYTEDQLVEQPAIGLFAELGWRTVSAMEELSRYRLFQHLFDRTYLFLGDLHQPPPSAAESAAVQAARLEPWPRLLVRLQVERILHHQAEHHAFAEQAVADEHSPRIDGTEARANTSCR